MSALAQALAKAGVVEEDKAKNIEKEKEFFKEKYYSLSQSIRQILNEKRRLQRIQDDIKNYKISEVTVREVSSLLNMPVMNLSATPNQIMVFDKIQASLAALEELVSPMLKASRKLEKDWGFTRPKKRK